MSPFDATGAQYAWDATSLNWAEECLYKYKLSMIDGWRAKSKSVHLLWGGWIATALEHFHKYKADGMEHDEALRAVVLEALTWTWADGKPWESDHNTKTRANLIRTIVWYTEEFKDDALRVVTLSDGSAAVEYSFKLAVDDGLFWCGHIDRLVDYGGDIYVQDQKTTQSTITPYWFDQFNPDNQMSGYAFAGRAIYGNPVKGVVIDGIQVAVGFSRFLRGFTFRTDSQLNEWYEHTLFHIHAARIATQNNYFPMNRTSCTKYGGCPFQQVCAKAPEVRERFLEGDFEKSEQWNPLQAR